jgi:hypothetical protein
MLAKTGMDLFLARINFLRSTWTSRTLFVHFYVHPTVRPPELQDGDVSAWSTEQMNRATAAAMSQYHSQLLSYIPYLLYATLYATPLCYYSDPLMLHYSVYLNTIIFVQ